jgi:hypothetical protein
MGSGKLTETTARALLLDLYEREGWKALGYESWEKWGMSKTHANRLISSAEVRENLTPMGVVPTSERQTRPITSLPPDQQRDVWEEVVRTAPAGKVTARHVEKVVSDFTDHGTKSTVAVSDAMVFARMAISQLERIPTNDPRRIEALEKVALWIEQNKN